MLPSIHSDATHEAILQSGISARSDRLLVAYRDRAVYFELSGRGIPFLQGAWSASAVLDGVEHELAGEWEAICWNAEEDADYLELQLVVSDRLRIDRQLLLPRRGNMALLADSVLAPGAQRIRYQARWPVAEGLRPRSDTTTRAVALRGPAGAARVFPLALPAQRVHSTPGGLTAADKALELVVEQSGEALYAPLVIDWSSRRRLGEALWRPLTVSENGAALPLDVAAGYRLQVARDQWLVYHSFRGTEYARSVLGHHTWNETVIGPFGRDGEVDPLIQVE